MPDPHPPPPPPPGPPPSSSAPPPANPLPFDPHQPHSLLAALLHQTFLERDDARRLLDSYKDRAERAEGLLHQLHPSSSSHQLPPAPERDVFPSQPSPTNIATLLLQTQHQLDLTKAALANSEARFRAIFDAWDNYEKWQLEVERRAGDARSGVRKALANLCDSSRHEVPLPPPSLGLHRVSNPSLPATTTTTHPGFPPLPPSPSVPASRVRPRAASVDDADRKAPKRPKADEPAAAPYATLAQSHKLSPITSSRLPPPLPASSQPRSFPLPPPPQSSLPPILPRNDTSETHVLIQPIFHHHSFPVPQHHHKLKSEPFSAPNVERPTHLSRPSRDSSSSIRSPIDPTPRMDDATSESGNSIDEMILEASTLLPPPPPPHLHQPPPHPKGPGGGGRGNTRARFGHDGGAISAVTVHPAVNDEGLRTCRQCGLPGRYKDGKCIEKWGPGPLGPGTVCDRCRKKMKRNERRGQQLDALANINVAGGNTSTSVARSTRHQQIVEVGIHVKAEKMAPSSSGLHTETSFVYASRMEGDPKERRQTTPGDGSGSHSRSPISELDQPDPELTSVEGRGENKNVNVGDESEDDELDTDNREEGINQSQNVVADEDDEVSPIDGHALLMKQIDERTGGSDNRETTIHRDSKAGVGS